MTPTSSITRLNKAANITSWVAQGTLALVFLLHSTVFINPPSEVMETLRTLPFPLSFMRFIILAEILGAVGLLAPAATRILPWLTPIAAGCLGIIMLGATGFHLVRGEGSRALIPLALFLLTQWVFYVRLQLAPITPRTKPLPHNQR